MLDSSVHSKSFGLRFVGVRAAVVKALRRKLEAAGLACHVEAVAQWSDWSGAQSSLRLVCVDGKDLDALQRTMARLRDELRARHIPIVALIDAEDSALLRRAFELGVDDVLTLPLRGEEAVVRVHALLNGLRHRTRFPGQPLDIDLHNQCLYHGGATYALGPVICQILLLFTLHPGSVLSRAFLSSALARTSVALDTRSIDVYVGRLRRVLAAAGGVGAIRTVRGRGYRYEPAPTRRKAAPGDVKIPPHLTPVLR